MSSSCVGSDQEGPFGPLAFVFFSLLTLGVGKWLPLCSCCFCPVWPGSSSGLTWGGCWSHRSHTHPIPRGLSSLVATSTIECELDTLWFARFGGRKAAEPHCTRTESTPPPRPDWGLTSLSVFCLAPGGLLYFIYLNASDGVLNPGSLMTQECSNSARKPVP